MKMLELNLKEKTWKRILGIDSKYVLATWSIFYLLCITRYDSKINFIILIGILLWILNSTILRFADQTSLYLMMFSIKYSSNNSQSRFLRISWILVGCITFTFYN